MIMVMIRQQVEIPVGNIHLKGILTILQDAKALVIFSHGSGSSRYSPRNANMARQLNKAGIGTLLIDLLTPDEDSRCENRFDIDLLSQRLIAATNFMHQLPALKNLP